MEREQTVKYSLRQWIGAFALRFVPFAVKQFTVFPKRSI